MDTKTPLRGQPGMDDLKIGPAGQTFAQLKSDVRATRAAYTSCPCDHHLGALESSVSLLRAAYVRVSLPYKAP